MKGFLLLVELGDELFLLCDLVIQVSDLVVLRLLILFSFLQGQLKIFVVFLVSSDLTLEFPLVLSEFLGRILLAVAALLELAELALEISLLTVDLGKSLFDVSGSGTLGFKLQEQLVLLLDQLGVLGFEFLAQFLFLGKLLRLLLQFVLEGW